MKTQPQKAENAERPMNHGQFYRSAELVAGVHRAEGGIFDTFPALVSFAQVSYPLHTFYFVHAAGAGRWARYVEHGRLRRGFG